MYRQLLSLLAIVALPAVTIARAHAAAAKPAYFLLAGDSTTATQSANGGGWGDGFLNYTLANGSSGHNYGHNGATTASFRAGGDWATVISQVQSHTSAYTVYVTIQVCRAHRAGFLLQRKRRCEIVYILTKPFSSAITTRRTRPASPLRNIKQTSKTSSTRPNRPVRFR